MATEPDSKPDEKPKVDTAPEAAEAEIDKSHDGERREFIVKAGSIVFGGLVVVAPVGAGLATLFSPMLSESAAGLKVLLASVGDLPADGSPKRFDVVAEKTDGWMKYPPKPIGGVFLRKVSDTEVVAFNSSCPHAGCSVGFKSELKHFHCPCHDSVFEIDGSRGETCVSARGLDKLEVDGEALAQKGEVWVTFVNYKAGVAEENKTL
jgi:menaquinol-cytochrome c reductase iron-sulfur subunit